MANRQALFEGLERIEERVSELATAISAPNSSGQTNGAAQSRQPRTPFRTVEDEVSRIFGRPGPSQDHQAAPVFGLRRNFRGSSRDPSYGRSSSNKKKRVADYGRFDVDVFLLYGPHVKKVQRQGARAWLI